MDARERARGERAILIVGEEFDQQRARFLVDRMRGRVDCGVEGAVGIFGQFEGRLHAVLHRSRIGLRHGYVDAHLMNVGDREQGPAIVRVRLDQRPDIDIARGDDSVERRDDVGERFQRLHPIDVGLGGLHFGSLCVRVAVFFVSGLLRHRRRRPERVPAIGCHLGQRHIRLGLREFALRHGHALVELRRVDDGQHIASMDLSADILAPFADIAAYLAMNGSGVESLDIAGQNKFAGFASLLQRDQSD